MSELTTKLLPNDTQSYHPQKEKRPRGISYSTARTRNFRWFVHGLVAPGLLFFELWDLETPLLGLPAPIFYFCSIGLAVPWESFAICLSTLATLGLMDNCMAYQVLLVFCALISSAVGLQKFRKLADMQKEYEWKKSEEGSDDDWDLVDRVQDPVPAGLELDTLRWAESQRLRERKQARDQFRQQTVLCAAVPLESVDAVV